jgi:hypothetical protein
LNDEEAASIYEKLFQESQKADSTYSNEFGMSASSFSTEMNTSKK